MWHPVALCHCVKVLHPRPSYGKGCFRKSCVAPRESSQCKRARCRDYTPVGKSHRMFRFRKRDPTVFLLRQTITRVQILIWVLSTVTCYCQGVYTISVGICDEVFRTLMDYCFFLIFGMTEQRKQCCNVHIIIFKKNLEGGCDILLHIVLY